MLFFTRPLGRFDATFYSLGGIFRLIRASEASETVRAVPAPIFASPLALRSWFSFSARSSLAQPRPSGLTARSPLAQLSGYVFLPLFGNFAPLFPRSLASGLRSLLTRSCSWAILAVARSPLAPACSASAHRSLLARSCAPCALLSLAPRSLLCAAPGYRSLPARSCALRLPVPRASLVPGLPKRGYRSILARSCIA